MFEHQPPAQIAGDMATKTMMIVNHRKFKEIILHKTNIAPEIRPKPKRKGSIFQSHPFSGVNLLLVPREGICPSNHGFTKTVNNGMFTTNLNWFFRIPDQWLFLVPIEGGRQHIIPQLAVYTSYIPLIYCLLGGYMLPTTS